MSGIVTLNNNVRIKRDGNELNGENAIINLNTGVSKLLTSSSANSHYNMNGKKQVTKKRVRGFLVPKRK
jgi:lipopolysaccharide export system protein LptA